MPKTKNWHSKETFDDLESFHLYLSNLNAFACYKSNNSTLCDKTLKHTMRIRYFECNNKG